MVDSPQPLADGVELGSGRTRQIAAEICHPIQILGCGIAHLRENHSVLLEGKKDKLKDLAEAVHQLTDQAEDEQLSGDAEPLVIPGGDGGSGDATPVVDVKSAIIQLAVNFGSPEIFVDTSKNTALNLSIVI